MCVEYHIKFSFKTYLRVVLHDGTHYPKRKYVPVSLLRIHPYIMSNPDWPNSLDCTDLNQCGARRDAELCCLCYMSNPSTA